MTAAIWDYKCVSFVFFIAYADIVAAEDCCGTLERLWQARLPHQVSIIFNDCADNTWDWLL
jgi:hypothetical protein